MGRLAVQVCLLMALAAVPAAKGMLVDGRIDDWSGENIFSDPNDDAWLGFNSAELTRWGVCREGGMLYAFCEISNTPISHFMEMSPAARPRRLVASVFIDADDNESTAIQNLYVPECPVYGADIVWEWEMAGPTAASSNPDMNNHYFYGAGDSAGVFGGLWATNGYAGQFAYDGYIMEFSCSISDLVRELSAYPDQVIPSDMMKAAICVKGNDRETIFWGEDYSGPAYVSIPEPMTLGLLMVGGLALIRRKRA